MILKSRSGNRGGFLLQQYFHGYRMPPESLVNSLPASTPKPLQTVINLKRLSLNVPLLLFYICRMTTIKKKVSLGFATGLLILLISCSNDKKTTPNDEAENAKDTAMITKKKTIVFFGNSLTAGYGLSPEQAFPALIQKKIDSLDLPYTIVNAGVSGETSSGGLTRIDWILQQRVDIFVLELGANDGLRGIEPLSITRQNLQEIIDRVKAKNPNVKILLAGMQVPPNMGQQYSTEFKNMFPDLANKNSVALIPFLLKDVGGEKDLNQADGIHPTAQGHRIVAENVWEELQKLVEP
jgi:acyl-CoA thioesterase I